MHCRCEEMSDLFDILYVCPPPGSEFLKKLPDLAVRVHCGEYRPAAPDVVVKLGGNIYAVMRDEQNIIALLNRFKRLMVGNKPCSSTLLRMEKSASRYAGSST